MSQRVGKGKAAKIYLKARNDEEDEKAMTQTGTKKCGCPFLINVKENADSSWYVIVICVEAQSRARKKLGRPFICRRLDKRMDLALWLGLAPQYQIPPP
ncbi:hypothetical protein Scep_018355 [Stephania cephalantha]|uniref:Uncharacterized protein n=1 Tax=Stephania cephalantha TaxID=152367 RepID=A0AAP0NUI0_9MAGN